MKSASFLSISYVHYILTSPVQTYSTAIFSFESVLSHFKGTCGFFSVQAAVRFVTVDFPRVRRHSCLIPCPDLGGHLPPLACMNDPLHILMQPGPFPRQCSESTSTSAASASPQSPKAVRLDIPRASLSATSLLNPFYGYPVLFVGSDVAPEHGRRRKRDLIYTLARLWWARWKSHIMAIFLVLLFAISSKSSRAWLDQWLRKRVWRLESHRQRP